MEKLRVDRESLMEEIESQAGKLILPKRCLQQCVHTAATSGTQIS